MKRIHSKTWLCTFLVLAPGAAWSNGRADAPNVLINPSFEEGRKGWSWREASPYWHDFDITTKRSHQGRHSAHLRLVSEQQRVPRIWGIVQALPLERLPGKLDLWYRIENWHQAVARQYVQVVVMVHGEPYFTNPTDTTRQVRYILGGLLSPPYSDGSNCKYRMMAPKVPRQGVWTRFTTNVAEDFKEAWGSLPGPFSKIEVFFEVRYDDPIPAGKVASAEVYWDDFFLTP